MREASFHFISSVDFDFLFTYFSSIDKTHNNFCLPYFTLSCRPAPYCLVFHVQKNKCKKAFKRSLANLDVRPPWHWWYRVIGTGHWVHLIFPATTIFGGYCEVDQWLKSQNWSRGGCAADHVIMFGLTWLVFSMCQSWRNGPKRRFLYGILSRECFRIMYQGNVNILIHTRNLKKSFHNDFQTAK